jgi:hypothetical protein
MSEKSGKYLRKFDIMYLTAYFCWNAVKIRCLNTLKAGCFYPAIISKWGFANVQN